MPVKIKCPACHRTLQVKERMLGKSIRCPACEASFAVPSNGSHSASAEMEEAGSTNGNSPSPSSISSAPKTNHIGRFHITAALGQGGFGTVYKAHDPILDRDVALKIPRHGTQGAERLILEAKAAAPLRHPHIVAVYEAGADGDDLYIATEYVEGQTLADYAQQNSVEQKTAAEWVKHLAEALNYAHQEKVVHRDVKPHNIMIGTSGRAQLMDFGLAQSPADTEQGDGQAAVIGTPAYMSPEQARGDTSRIGPASDQYSLGCVLYELLTGARPFNGGPDTVSQVAAGKTAPRPRAVNANIHRDLEAICQKAMAAEPQQRYSDCGALADDIGRWLNDELVRARRYSPVELLVYWARKRPTMFAWTAAAVCLIAVLLGGGVAYGVNHMLASKEPISSEPLPATTVSTTNASNTEQSNTSGLDGEMHRYGRLLDRTRYSLRVEDVVRADRWLEQTRWDFRNWEYRYLRKIVTGGWKTIRAHYGEITALAMHPDGEQFASASVDGRIRVWRIATGEQLQALQSNHPVTSLAYSPDGRVLAIATGISGEQPSQVMGGEYGMAPPMPMATPGPSIEGTPVPAPIATPAQQPAAAPARPIQYVVSLRSADTLEEVGVYREHTGPISSIAFSPDGQSIASGGQAVAQNAEPAQQQPFAGPAPHVGELKLWNAATQQTEKVLAVTSGGVARVAFSADGQRVIAVCGRDMMGQLCIWNLDPSAPKMPAPGPVAPAPLAPGGPVAFAAPPPNNANALMPEQQYMGAYRALAIGSATTGQIAAAPALDLWLLENGRRRIQGNLAVFDRWTKSAGDVPDTVHGNWSAIYDMAFASESLAGGNQPLLMAGGDPLLRNSPGAIFLRDPIYDDGNNVSHLGHKTAVTAVVFRPDGKQFISGSADGTIKIWSAEVHPEVVRVGPMRSATRVAFGRNGRFVAVADRRESWSGGMPMPPMAPGQETSGEFQLPRGEVKLFDIRNAQEVTKFISGPGDVLGLAIDPTPQMAWIAAGGEDASVHVWNLETGKLRFEAEAGHIVRCLAVSADGQLLAAACGNKNPYATHAAPGLMMPGAPVVAPPQASINNAAVPANAIALNSCGPQDAPTAEPQPAEAPPPVLGEEPEAHQPRHGRVFDPAGEIVLWNTSDGKEIVRWKAHAGDVLSVALSGDGKLLVSSGEDRKVKLWDVATQQQIRSLEDYEGEIADLVFSPTGQEFAGAGYDPCRPDKPGDIIVWRVDDGRRHLQLSTFSGLMYGVAYSPDGKRIVSGGGAHYGSRSLPGEVRVWDAATGIELLPLAGRPGRESKQMSYQATYCYPVQVKAINHVTETRVNKVAEVGPDGNTIFRDVEETVTVPVEETRSELRTATKSVTNNVLWEEPGAILSVAFSGDGRSIAAACEDGSALVWNAEICQPYDTAQWTNGNMLCAATSPDGNWIATAGDSGDHCECRGLIRIYNAKTGQLAREITTSAGSVLDIGFTHDSRRIVIAGGRGAWMPSSCATDAPVAPLRPDVYSNFFTLQQNVDKSGTAEVWDITTGERVVELAGSAQTMTSVAVHPLGDQVLTGSQDGMVRLCAVNSGKELMNWTNSSAVLALAFHPSGERFAAATADGSVWLGNLQEKDSAALQLVSKDVPGVMDVIFDPSGKQLLAVTQEGFAAQPFVANSLPNEAIFSELNSATGKLLQWNLESPQKPSIFSLRNAARNAAFDPHGQWLAIGDTSASVCLVEATTGRRKLNLTGHQDYAAVSSLPDGRIVSISMDRKVRVWHVDEALGNVNECSDCTRPSHPAISIETNPQVFVHKVRFSRDGKQALVGGHMMEMPSPAIDHPVRIVDAATGASRHFGGHYDVVRSVAVRPDQPQFASVGQDQHLYVWNENATSLPADDLANKVMKVIYSRDGKTMATATAFDGQVQLWNSDTVKKIREFQVEPMTAFALAFDKDGRQLITGGLSGAIKVWNVDNGQLVREWPAHEGTIQSVVLNGGGTTLASCGHDQKVKLWNFENGELLKTLEGFAGPAWDCAFHPDDSLLAVGAHDPVARIFNVETGQLVTELSEHGQGVWSIAFSPDGSKLACCGRESPLVIWNWQEKTQVSKNPQAGECLAWWSDGSKLITGSVLGAPQTPPKYDAVISLHDAATGRLIETVTVADAPRPEFDISGDGRYVAVGQQDGTVVLWDRANKRFSAKCAHGSIIRSLVFNPDSNQNSLAVIAEDNNVHIWSTDGTEIASLAHEQPLLCLAYDAAGRILAVGDQQGTVYLWDVQQREQMRTLTENNGELCALSFSGDGHSLAAVTRRAEGDGWAGTLNVWDVRSGSRTLAIPAHTWWEADVSFHPRQPHIATTGREHTLQIYHAKTGQLLLNVPTHGHLCNTMRFSPDGKRLLAQIAGQVKLIDPIPQPASPFAAATEPATPRAMPTPTFSAPQLQPAPQVQPSAPQTSTTIVPPGRT